MRMTTPVTTRKGEDDAKLGIGPCSFCSRNWAGNDNEVAAGNRNDLDHPSRWNFGIGGGGHVVRRAGEADEYRAEMVGGDSERQAARRADPVLQAERVCGFCLL